MKNKMKKVLSLLAAVSILTLSLAACGGDSAETPAPDGEETASISGTVSTNGSTSMEKVVGVLSEQFMMDNT
ncbi:MAG: phosphate ABC transporter phosphate-binding protein, partial [Ruminiclostridium sp.]|nr:phosphate ABC transporter phosphate-binding protein [Ruminiclostridium sp.]